MKQHTKYGIAHKLFYEAKKFFTSEGLEYYTVFTAVSDQAGVGFYRANGLDPLLITLIGETNPVVKT